MPIYKYKSANQKGEIVSGIFSANSVEEVIVMVRSNRQLPIEVKPLNTAAAARGIEFQKKVNIKDLSVLCNQFNTLLKSGVTVVKCIDIFRTQSENKLMRDAFAQVYRDVQIGTMLSEALRQHKTVFPDFLVNMIESGEMSGNLEGVTARLALHYEKENFVQNKIKGAMIYPILLSIISVVVVVGLMVFVMPTFISLFTESGAALPAPTRAMLAISNFLIEKWYIVLAVAAVIAIVAPVFLGSPQGKLMLDRLALKVPVISTMTVKVAASRFSRTLSTLLHSGVPLLQSMEITAKVIGNKVFENMILSAGEEVKKGSDLSTPIEASGLFPPILHNMIRIGETSGLLDESLERAANLYDAEVDDAVSKLSSIMEPIMIVVMAVVVGGIVIAIAMPMFQMYENISF